MPDGSARASALDRLGAFVGEWTEQVGVPDVPPGRVVFEWALGGQFLLQRSEIPQPEFPDSIAIIAVDPSGEAYTQHYFDSRGVVRVYAMGFRDGVWTLVRDAGLHAVELLTAVHRHIRGRRPDDRRSLGDL